VASEVRAVGIVQNPGAALAQQRNYRLDVIARPITVPNDENEPENLAHAQIESDPTIDSASRFDRVKEALARLAGNRPWALEPQPRPPEPAANDDRA
jgi:hypothetical protein